MDFTSFRHSEELSDIEIILQPQNRHYSLHKFPLYTKSQYIRELVANDSELKSVELKHFPGGVDNFERVVDFCYSHFIDVKKENVLELYLAGRFLSMQGFGNLIEVSDRHLTDLFASAKLTRQVGLIIGVLVQCKEEYKEAFTDQHRPKVEDSQDESVNYVQEIEDRCVETIIEIWSKPPSRFPYKRDQGPNIQDLEIEIVKKIIQAGTKTEIRSEVLMNVIREYTEHHLPKKRKEEPTKEDQSLRLNLPLDLNSEDEEEEEKKEEEEKMDKQKTDGEGGQNSSDSEDEEAEDKKEETKEGEETEAKGEDDQANQNEENENKDDDEEPEGEENPETKTANEESQQHGKNDQSKSQEQQETPEEKEARENEFSAKLDNLVMELPEKPRILRDENSVRWIIQALEIANRKKCECRDRLLYAASTILAQIPEQELRTMTPDLVCDLLHEAGQSGFHFANTVSVITDFYILDKAKEGCLDRESFVKLATALPEGFRTNVDTLYEAYGIMAKECTPEERESILGALDLSRLSEETMGKAYENKAIEAEQLVPALINRCKRLRGDLEKAKEVIKKKEADQYKLAMNRVYYTPRESLKRTPPAPQMAWPHSARYEPIKLAPSAHLPSSSGGSLPSSPRHHHKAVLVKPVPTKPQVPMSARYHHEKPKPLTPLKQVLTPTRDTRSTVLTPTRDGQRGGPRTGAPGPRTGAPGPRAGAHGKGGSLPGTPRGDWRPSKAQRSLGPYLSPDIVPDYSSSGIGPDDVRQIFHELALTSPRFGQMYQGYDEDEPVRDHSSFSPIRRGKQF